MRELLKRYTQYVVVRIAGTMVSYTHTKDMLRMNRSLAIGVLCLASTGIVRDSLAIDYTKNYIPNGSFESVNAEVADFAANGENGVQEQGWIGGIITCGGSKTFCTPAMADGTYGLALHYAYPEATNTFVLPQGGIYELSYRLTCRNRNKVSTQQALYVYFDDDSSPASAMSPKSYSEWIAVTNVVRLSAGRHRIRLVGVGASSERDCSAVVDDIRLMLMPDVLENGSFETVLPGTWARSGDYAINEDGGVPVVKWTGGIVTLGGDKAFCKPPVKDGILAMALHNSYPVISNRFEVIDAGSYELSFYTTSRESVRSGGKQWPACTQTVSVYFDDGTKPVCAVLPTSTTGWDCWAFTNRLKAGEHVIRFVGSNPILPEIDPVNPVDSSTIIDAVRLRLTQKAPGLAIILY